MTDPEKVNNNQELFVIRNQWQELQSNPNLLTDLSEKNIVFCAGGGLVKRFGVEDSGIWKSMEASAVEGMIKVAGIEFQVDNLKLMGEFYRYLESKGVKFHCIDERLKGDEDHLNDEVHCKCGACNEVGKAVGSDGIEDVLVSELGQNSKQDVYEDMEDHESLVILVDLHGSDVVLGDKREELKRFKALPFNVSLQLNHIRDFLNSRSEVDAGQLVNTLVQWNVQIARNIIGGHHNTLHQSADHTIVMLDTRDVVRDNLFELAVKEIGKVDHGVLLEIKSPNAA